DKRRAQTLARADLSFVVATAADHAVNAGCFHRFDLAIPEAPTLRSPHAGRERRARAQRARAASVLGDTLRRLKPDEETRAMRRGDTHGLVALAADPNR